MKQLPNTILGLIEALESQYPPKCLTPTQTRPEADHYAGKVALVAELRERSEAELRRNKRDLPAVL